MTQQINMFHVNDTVKLVSLKMVCEDTFKYSQTISSAQDIVNLVKPFYDGAWREMVISVCLNTANKPTTMGIVSIGSVNQAYVSPASVFKLALLSNASCIIFFHPAPYSSPIRQVIPKSSGLTCYQNSAHFSKTQEWVPDSIGTHAG